MIFYMLYRIGQNSNVKIIYLIAKGTSDEMMWEQLQRKQQMLDATVGQSGLLSSSIFI